LGFTVDTRLIVRDTVAMDTLANRATERMSILAGVSAAGGFVFFLTCFATFFAIWLSACNSLTAYPSGSHDRQNHKYHYHGLSGGDASWQRNILTNVLI
jgi:hypothetical protein